MCQDPKSEGKKLASDIRGLTPEQISERNAEGVKQAQQEHAEFSTAFKDGRCYWCLAELNSFYRIMPCYHWLLKPPRFTKNDFLAVATAYGYRHLSCYLRWVANEDVRAQNINDLPEEGTGKLIEETIRYKQFEWSFSCSENDYAGHDTNNPESQKPHYHFQMRVNRLPFIRYNDFHVPFTDEDLIDLEAQRSAPDLIKRVNPGGEGMRDLLHEVAPELLIEHGRSITDAERGTLSLSTMIMAPDGETISGEKLQELFNEAKRTGVTATSLIHKNLGNANVQTIISPGEGVVEQAVRSGRGTRKKDKPSEPSY